MSKKITAEKVYSSGKAREEIEQALHSSGKASASQVFKGWAYDGSREVYGWHYQPFGQQPIYLGDTLPQALETITGSAPRRGHRSRQGDKMNIITRLAALSAALTGALLLASSSPTAWLVYTAAAVSFGIWLESCRPDGGSRMMGLLATALWPAFLFLVAFSPREGQEW